MKRTIKLSTEVEDILLRVFTTLGVGGEPPRDTRLAAAIEHLANGWDSMQDDTPGDPNELDISSLIKRITDPDVGLALTVNSNPSSPRDLTGLIPLDYILKQYPGLMEKLNATEEVAQIAARIALTRIPETAWETEQTRSIVARALLEVS